METARYLQPSSNVSDFELQFIQTAPFRKKKTGSLGFATIQFATIKPFFKHGKSFVFKMIKIHFFLISIKHYFRLLNNDCFKVAATQ